MSSGMKKKFRESPKNGFKTYEPDNILKHGYFRIFSDIFSDIFKNHWLTFQLFKRDFLAIYKQSLIGVVWAVIVPLISVGTFVILNSSGVFSIGDLSIPYIVFAVLGMALWQVFATGIIASSHSLVKAGNMIMKINFSKKSLVIASLGQSLISFIIQFVLVIALFVYYGLMPTAWVFALPLFVIPILLITLGLGFILSILNGIMRDIGNIISILMTFLMFLTPVLYVKPSSGILAVISDYNPLHYLVSLPSDLILGGESVLIRGYLVSCALSAMVFLICIFIFHLTETRVTERV